MKLKFLFGILLIVILISGAGCEKDTYVPETNGEPEETILIGQVTKLFTERTKGLDPEQNSYFYYKVDAGKGMKVTTSSEKIFTTEIMSGEDCRLKTKEESYNTLIKKENVKSYDFSSRDEDIINEDKEWCVIVTNSGSEFTSVKVKIEELSY